MTTSATPMPETPVARTRRNRGVIAAAMLVGVLGVFGWMLYGGMEDNLVYFLTPKELHAKGTKAYNRPVRLGGQVVPGSVQWNAEQLDLRFKVTDGEREVAVHAKGAPPQMFRAGIGVVVEGKYGRNAVFESHSLMVKHSNEYKAPEAGKHPPRLDKTLIRPST
jgi:cytochrome c-type biogenesis protein CcmE